MDFEVSETEVDELLNAVTEHIDAGTSKFRGMTYEQGIRDAIEWIIGRSDSNLVEDYQDAPPDSDSRADDAEDEDEEEDANL